MHSLSSGTGWKKWSGAWEEEEDCDSAWKDRDGAWACFLVGFVDGGLFLYLGLAAGWCVG